MVNSLPHAGQWQLLEKNVTNNREVQFGLVIKALN